MYFCIRDDDTSFFTQPEELEQVYGEISQWGPVSLAVVPFHRAGTSKAIPEKFRGRWSVHPLHKNKGLVDYLRSAITQGRFEIMLHGYYHDDPRGIAEFAAGDDLASRVTDGRKYLEDLLGTRIRVFVPPHNTIRRHGLGAVTYAGLHLGCVSGIKSGWSPLSLKTWQIRSRLRRWQRKGGIGIPWILDLGDHREIAANPITPKSYLQRNNDALELALEIDGVFCGAIHYWEISAPSVHVGEPSVGEQLRYLVDRARSNRQIFWRSVGDIVSDCKAAI